MKVCITSTGNTPESTMDPRFGRAAWFIIIDTDTMEIEPVENSAAISGGGVGIASGQLMIDGGVEAVITGNVGPNAERVLKAANIRLYKGSAVSVKENFEAFKKGLLEEIDTAVPSHFGMNFHGGQR